MNLKRKHLARNIVIGDLFSAAHGAVYYSSYQVVLRVDKRGYDWSMLILLTADGRVIELDVWDVDIREKDSLFACWSRID